MQGAEDRAERDYGKHGHRPGKVPFGQHDRQQYAEQRESRPDRQIDPAGDDHESQPEAEDAERADEPRRVLKVGRRHESRVERRDNDAQHHQQQEGCEFLSHGGGDCIARFR
jgi:hypothetical protein